MKVNYLFAGWTHTGGSMVLYNFMDKLCERGHTVHAVTPDSSILWQPRLSQQIVRSFAKERTWEAAKRIVKRCVPVQLLKSIVALQSSKMKRELVEGLIRNWVDSQVTIATYCTTAFASYALRERTI